MRDNYRIAKRLLALQRSIREFGSEGVFDGFTGNHIGEYRHCGADPRPRTSDAAERGSGAPGYEIAPRAAVGRCDAAWPFGFWPSAESRRYFVISDGLPGGHAVADAGAPGLPPHHPCR